jgi:hypothetical protein
MSQFENEFEKMGKVDNSQIESKDRKISPSIGSSEYHASSTSGLDPSLASREAFGRFDGETLEEEMLVVDDEGAPSRQEEYQSGVKKLLVVNDEHSIKEQLILLNSRIQEYIRSQIVRIIEAQEDIEARKKATAKETAIAFLYGTIFYMWTFSNWVEAFLYAWKRVDIFAIKRPIRRWGDQIIEFRNRIIDNWSKEQTYIVILLPFGLLVGSWQATFSRYSHFLKPELEKPGSIIPLEFKKFKNKRFFSGQRCQVRKIEMYDKFILITRDVPQPRFARSAAPAQDGALLDRAERDGLGLKTTEKYLITIPPNISKRETIFFLRDLFAYNNSLPPMMEYSGRSEANGASPSLGALASSGSARASRSARSSRAPLASLREKRSTSAAPSGLRPEQLR